MSTLDLSLGAIEVGILISVFFYGVSTVQVYVYYSGTAKDRWYIRTLVPLIWVIETLHTLFMCHFLYYVTVTNYGNIEALAVGQWTLTTSGFFDGLVGALVQSFFAHRIYVLSRRWPITIISWIGSFLACVATFTIMILSLSLSVAGFAEKYLWLVKTGLSLLLCVDVVNTVALCYYLRVERTGYANTDGILNKLFLWTLQTGIVTSVGGLLMLIFSLALPATTLWICVSIFYAKLYSNSFMATLNSRDSLRMGMQETNISSAGQARVQVSVHQDISVEMTSRSTQLSEKRSRASFNSISE